jgi:hypothetical protein
MVIAGFVFALLVPKVLPTDCNYMPVLSFVSAASVGASITFGAVALLRGFGAKMLIGAFATAFMGAVMWTLSHFCG